jgi:diadenylate cyclase
MSIIDVGMGKQSLTFLKIGLSVSDFQLKGTVFQYISIIADIALVWLLVYTILTLIRGTKAVQLIKGIILIVIVQLCSYFFQLHTVYQIIEKAMEWGVLAIIVIFQPELRRALEQIGRGSLFSLNNSSKSEQANNINEIIKAIEYMAKRRIGALIAFERQTGMGDYIETGIGIHAEITSELLINIFIPNTPLHDGAVILRHGEIIAASCYLPLSENQFVSKELGTRHRAALGISEVTDSVTIVVSEETGSITVAKNGKLFRQLNSEALTNILIDAFQSNELESSSFWTWKVKRNG